MLVHQFNTEMTVVSIVHYVVCGEKISGKEYTLTQPTIIIVLVSLEVSEIRFCLIKRMLCGKNYLHYP